VIAHFLSRTGKKKRTTHPIRHVFGGIHDIIPTILDAIPDTIETVLNTVSESIETFLDVLGNVLDFADFFTGPAGGIFGEVSDVLLEAVFVFIEIFVCFFPWLDE
jgi:hypothetical protein